MVGFHDTAMVDGPGVVIGRSGSIGGAQWIDSDFWPLNTTLWVKDFRGNDARWVYYLLRSIDFTGYNVGSGVPTLNRNHLTHISVPVPSLSEQRAIAEVLGALDDKIEANNAVRDLADCTWRALLNQARAESEWVPVPLSSLARFINGKAYTKNATGTGRMVVRIAELNSGPGGSTVYNDIDVPSESLAQPGDLLFAWSGSLTVQRWHRPAAIINQHIFKVLPNGDTPLWLLHGLLLDLLPYFQGIASGKATTMGHIQRHHLDEPVPFPLPAKMSDLDRICAPLWQRALATEQESLVLEQLRDALLPKLLSGELRVRDAEALVGGAV
jgi:type I restriction enzyme S subunit